MLIYEVWFSLTALIVAPFLNAYCVIKGLDSYPAKFYYYDNEEDGFDGDKRGWYSDYLKTDIKSNKLKRWFYSVLWCYRNLAFNSRYHPKCSVDVTQPKNIRFKGNTHHHEVKWSLEPEVKETKWYKFTANFEGKDYTTRFWLIPLGNKWIYIRFGLKVYPFYYLDDRWLSRIEKDGWPKHKDKGVFTYMRPFPDRLQQLRLDA